MIVYHPSHRRVLLGGPQELFEPVVFGDIPNKASRVNKFSVLPESVCELMITCFADPSLQRSSAGKFRTSSFRVSLAQKSANVLLVNVEVAERMSNVLLPGIPEKIQQGLICPQDALIGTHLLYALNRVFQDIG